MISHKQIAQAISIAAVAGVMVTIPGKVAAESPGIKTATATSTLSRSIQIAICLEDWDHAVDLVGNLIARPELSPSQRDQLVSTRHQLQSLLLRHEAIPLSSDQCDTMLAEYIQPMPTPNAPVDWDRAFYSAFGATDFNPLPDQEARQQAAARQAGLTPVLETPIDPLSPARVISTHSGSGVSAGAVSTGVNIFSFVGAAGDRLSIRLRVTEVLPGRLYIDDDSQMFLFDNTGILLAENDDLSRLQSEIMEFALPQTGVYYLAITTYNNDPILDSSQRITDWTGNGGSSVEYTITVTGLTPAGQLTLGVEK